MRKEESSNIRDRYPDRIPVIIERSNAASQVPLIDKIKYLVPNDLTVYHLSYIVRKRLKFRDQDALFLYCGTALLKSDSVMMNVYNNRKDPDDFLYITYAQESVFGSAGVG
jgi:GABA(A) receptor-associated protein